MDTEKILLDTFSGTALDEFPRELQTVVDHFDDDVDVKRLTIQLSMLSLCAVVISQPVLQISFINCKTWVKPRRCSPKCAS